MIPIAQPLLGRGEQEAVAAVLASGRLVSGSRVAEFQRAFAEFVGAKHVVTTSSGTTALQVALLAHGIAPGDEVITSPFSFFATAGAILSAGATPVFVDVDETFNLDPASVQSSISARTRAILPVHLYGQPADMNALTALVERYGLALIEDACQAHGAAFAGHHAGTFGTGCFSFYATKNMTTGEGGCLTTDDDDLAAEARLIINQGMRKPYHHERAGNNFRLSEIAAAIGIEQLRRLPAFNVRRAETAAFYGERLRAVPGLLLPAELPGRRHAWHQYTLRVTEQYGLSRDGLVEALASAGIQAGVYYPIPLHRQPALAGHPASTLSFPRAEQLSSEVISIPVHPGVSDADREHVVATLLRLAEPG